MVRQVYCTLPAGCYSRTKNLSSKEMHVPRHTHHCFACRQLLLVTPARRQPQNAVPPLAAGRRQAAEGLPPAFLPLLRANQDSRIVNPDAGECACSFCSLVCVFRCPITLKRLQVTKVAADAPAATKANYRPRRTFAAFFVLVQVL